MFNDQVPQAAWDRFDQLDREERIVNRAVQIGTSIPELFAQRDSYVSNPSAVGTGILSRMIETDDAVSSAVQFKILMIMAKIGEYHHADAEIGGFVNGFLNRLRGPTWHESLEAMLSAKAFGFSVSEIVMSIDEEMRKVPIRLPTYHPSTVAFEVDASGQVTPNGVIQFVMQNTQFSNPNGRQHGVQYGQQIRNPFATPTDRLMPYRIPFMYQYGMVRIPRRKVIHLTNLPMFSFGSPYGKTEVRTAHLSWQLKQYMMKQLGIASKRNATGFVWGSAPQGGQNVDVMNPDTGLFEKKTPTDALRFMLAKREGDDSVVTGPAGPNGYNISSIAQQTNLDQFLSVINNLDVRIFRCFLLPSLVMTDGSAGNRALGDKHFQIVDRIAESESTKFCQSIVNDMIEPIIRANFGHRDDGYGAFKPRPQSIEERERLSNMFGTLANAGVLKPGVEEDMDFIRQALSLPKDADPGFKFPEDETDDEPADEGERPPTPDTE